MANEKASFGDYNLDVGANGDKVACAKFLVSKGANVNARDSYGRTVLMMTGDVGLVRFLVAKGVDVNVRDDNGNTALSQAHDHPDIIAVLKAAGAKE